MKSDIFKKEVSYVNDERVKKSLVTMLELLPDYFYEIPASSTGKYHPSFTLGNGGLVRHTKVAAKIAKEIIYNNSIGNVFTPIEKDLIIMAITLHDGLKEGNPKETYTRFDHPILMANFVMENKDKLEITEDECKLVASMISTHMGEWNTNAYSKETLPLPKNKYQKMVHMCDYLASRKFLDVKFEEDNIIE